MMPTRDPLYEDQPALNKPLIGVAAAVALAALGGWLYWYRHTAPPPAPIAAIPTAVKAIAPADVIEHPVPAPDASKGPLPELSKSDTEFGAALASAVRGDTARYLVLDDIVRHLVVTVDNLPRQKVALEKRPVTATAGQFAADGDELHATLDPQNFRRYEPLVSLLQDTDMQRVAAVYVRFYPLFQKAYQDLGYPNGYFNDRVIQVIDLLIATPQLAGQIELVRPNVMYVFADPTLEALPAGQKLLIRMGGDNAVAVKAKLTQLRAAILAAAPKH